MKWLHLAVRKGEVSWQGMRRGEVGEKCERLIAGILLCAFNSTVELSAVQSSLVCWEGRGHFSWLGCCQVNIGSCWCSSELPDLQSGSLRLAPSEVCYWRTRAAGQILLQGGVPSAPVRPTFCFSDEGDVFFFPVTMNMTEKKIGCKGTQKSFDFLGTYSRNNNALPRHPTQIVVYPQLFCVITCIIISLDILSKIHVRYQQLQDSTPGMAPFQWWNHTGMCFSSKR